MKENEKNGPFFCSQTGPKSGHFTPVSEVSTCLPLPRLKARAHLEMGVKWPNINTVPSITQLCFSFFPSTMFCHSWPLLSMHQSMEPDDNNNDDFMLSLRSGVVPFFFFICMWHMLMDTPNSAQVQVIATMNDESGLIYLHR